MSQKITHFFRKENPCFIAFIFPSLLLIGWPLVAYLTLFVGAFLTYLTGLEALIINTFKTGVLLYPVVYGLSVYACVHVKTSRTKELVPIFLHVYILIFAVLLWPMLGSTRVEGVGSSASSMDDAQPERLYFDVNPRH